MKILSDKETFEIKKSLLFGEEAESIIANASPSELRDIASEARKTLITQSSDLAMSDPSAYQRLTDILVAANGRISELVEEIELETETGNTESSYENQSLFDSSDPDWKQVASGFSDAKAAELYRAYHEQGNKIAAAAFAEQAGISYDPEVNGNV